MQKYANHRHSIPVLRYFGNKSVAGRAGNGERDFGDELDRTAGLLKYCTLRRPPWLLRSRDGARQCLTMRKRQRKGQAYCQGETRATGHP